MRSNPITRSALARDVRVVCVVTFAIATGACAATSEPGGVGAGGPSGGSSADDGGALANDGGVRDGDAGAHRDGAPTRDSGAPAPGDDAGNTTSCESGGAPIVAALDRWTWIDVAGSACGNGSPTGIGVNPTSRSNKLLVFMMGGGGCFDYASCHGQDQAHPAAHLDGYDGATFAADVRQSLGAGTVFDRQSQANPFKDYSFVFVPYCTGDFHSGSTVASYGTHHVGYTNMRAFTSRIAATFCGRVDEVVLAGSSAGGFGAVFNFDRVQSAFGATPVELVDDSGPTMSVQYMPRQTQMRASWGAVANLPAGCVGCDADWSRVLPFLAAKHPARRFSLLSSYYDSSIGPYFGMVPQQMKQGLEDYASQVLTPLANVRVYYLESYSHVWLGQALTQAYSGGVPLTRFLGDQASGAPTWTSVMP